MVSEHGVGNKSTMHNLADVNVPLSCYRQIKHLFPLKFTQVLPLSFSFGWNVKKH